MKSMFSGSKKMVLLVGVVMLLVGGGAFAAGNTLGRTDGYASGKKSGEKSGEKAGHETGYEEGHEEGYDKGYKEGLTKGEEKGFAAKLEEVESQPNKMVIPNFVGAKLGDINYNTTLGGYVFLSFKDGDNSCRVYISTESTDGEKVNWDKKMSYVVTKQSIAANSVLDLTKNFTKSGSSDFYESNEKLVLTVEKKSTDSAASNEDTPQEAKAFDVMEESVVGEDGIAPGTYIMTTDSSNALIRIDDADGNKLVYENMESVEKAKKDPTSGFISEKTVILKAGYTIYPGGSTLHFEPKE